MVGEISNLNNRTHWYFSLKDEEAVISCVMFASAARAMNAPPQHGDRVIATGRIEHYPTQGRTQLYVDKMEPIGAGALEAAVRHSCDLILLDCLMPTIDGFEVSERIRAGSAKRNR